MLLKKQTLNSILRDHRIQISDEIKNQLLETYGRAVATEDGRFIEYSEQDIYEQVRKILRPCENADKEVKYFTLT